MIFFTISATRCKKERQISWQISKVFPLARRSLRLYSVDMKTLTATKARQNLGNWLQRAANGEDIGIVHSATGKIIALRPVEVYSDDYAFSEYGIEPDEMERIAKNIIKKTKNEKRPHWDGTAKSLRG